MLELITIILFFKFFKTIMKAFIFIITTILTCALLTAFINAIILNQ